MAKKVTTKNVPALKEQEPPKTTTRAVAKATAGGPPAALLNKMSKDAGKGVSTDQADNMVPLIYVLQALSPQVNKRNPAFLEGAEPGAIWLKNHAEPIVSGEEGIEFQPCFFTKKWVEWIPRDSGGGFVAQLDELPVDVKKVEDPKNPNKVKYVRKNGNEMIETRYHIGRVKTAAGWMAYVIPMSSTGHTVSRQWMFTMNARQLPNGDKAPSFSSTYLLRTKEKSNAAGTWFTWDIASPSWVQTEEDYAAGLALHNAFAKGEKSIEAEEAVEADDGSM